MPSSGLQVGGKCRPRAGTCIGGASPLLKLHLPTPMQAVRIALAVKKDLVDRGRLEVSQEELESALTSALAIHGVGAHHLPRYRTVSAFFQRRAPLIVLLCGTACTGEKLKGKASLRMHVGMTAMTLCCRLLCLVSASRLCIPRNISEVVHPMLHSYPIHAPLPPSFVL